MHCCHASLLAALRHACVPMGMGGAVEAWHGIGQRSQHAPLPACRSGSRGAWRQAKAICVLSTCIQGYIFPWSYLYISSGQGDAVRCLAGALAAAAGTCNL